MFEASIKTHFSAAHHLVGYPGPCADQHGHNWEVEVSVRGGKLGKTGMLMDFRKIKETVRGVLGEIDHSDLNTHKAFRKQNPTSENIARFLYRELAKRLPDRGCRVAAVAVRETPESTATYWED
jgi:6-pyruvoyltetrahydropterin/6-carboxytetrahydropterin synthase